ncbi:MAG: glycoside hydrolase family 2 TIM barrel-domain containing protein, partial [Melioribacteraceae bacterium]
GIGNSAFSKTSQVSQSQNILIRINIFPAGSSVPQAKGEYAATISAEDNEAVLRLEINNPNLWSPRTPNFYLYEISLLRDGVVIDKAVRQFSIYKLSKNDNNFLLNGNPFSLQGTTYYLDESSLRKMSAYDKLRSDLILIKNTGFNSVRFPKSYPNPYAVKLCQELGLFALIELPLNSIPEEILADNDFQLRAINRARSSLSNYSEFGNTIILGAGSSFLINSETTQKFLSRIGKLMNEKGFLTYASFVGIQTNPINEIDFYGAELYSSSPEISREELQKGIESIGKNSLFISEMSYPNYYGNQSGYLAKFSSDAQAKYFRDMIDLARELKISGFFINSLFDYKGEYPSLYGGYSKDGIYKFGVLSSFRNLNGIGYKVLVSKLGSDTKVTIPIGTRKEDNSIIFILIALSLTLIMAVLVNIKKKFKEDCTRALLRPYNFYADIRDHRIMSGIHTTILMLIQAGSASLLITVLLYFYRTNILLEKLALSFGHHSFMNLLSYLAWNPVISFIFFSVVIIIKFALISAIIKFASFFIKTRVEFLSIFFMVVWSFLPFTVLLPLEAILFKILTMASLNSSVLIFLLFFFLWIFQRILKGIYVVFDVRPMLVYLYSFGIIILLAGAILIKYQATNSVLYYISNSFLQFNSMIL